MSHLDSLVGLAAMIPAALNPSLAVEQKALETAICGSAKTVSIPLGPPDLPGTVPAACCAKGCHAKRLKKDNSGKIDPAQ